MFGAHEYIKQQFKRPWYSEVLYQNSVAAGGSTIAEVDYGDLGAKMILITGLILCCDSTGGVVFFRDQFNRLLFRINFNNSNANGNCICLTTIIKSSTLFITADTANADFAFSVQHQYLREVDLKEEK